MNIETNLKYFIVEFLYFKTSDFKKIVFNTSKTRNKTTKIDHLKTLIFKLIDLYKIMKFYINQDQIRIKLEQKNFYPFII